MVTLYELSIHKKDDEKSEMSSEKEVQLHKYAMPQFFPALSSVLLQRNTTAVTLWKALAQLFGLTASLQCGTAGPE